MFEIKIQIMKRVFSLCVGHETFWFEQIPFILLVEEFYSDKNVTYAKVIFDF